MFPVNNQQRAKQHLADCKKVLFFSYKGTLVIVVVVACLLIELVSRFYSSAKVNFRRIQNRLFVLKAATDVIFHFKKDAALKQLSIFKYQTATSI